jgi:hypothetical protein
MPRRRPEDAHQRDVQHLRLRGARGAVWISRAKIKPAGSVQ